jgi:crotonobetainyl-CoA:carnitine CoA-transferase CaiB-like acyl-CoA transferase
MPGLIARFSRTPGEIRGAGRALGADTDAVLAELDARADDDAGRGRETPRGASA